MALVTRPIALFLLFFCANIQNLIFGGRAIFPFCEYFLLPCDRPDERAATRVINDNVAAIFVYTIRIRENPRGRLRMAILVLFRYSFFGQLGSDFSSII